MRAANFQLILIFLAFALSIRADRAAESGVKTEGRRTSLGNQVLALSSKRSLTQKKRKFKHVDESARFKLAAGDLLTELGYEV